MTASNKIALLVVKNKKPYTVVEELIMPAAKVLVKHVIAMKQCQNKAVFRCQIMQYSCVLQ